MNRDDILVFLRDHKQEIAKAYGVKRIGLFGSYARESATQNSDVDLLVEFDPDKKTLRNFFGVKRYLEEGLGKPVDLGLESALKPVVRQSILDDIDYA